MKKNILAVIEAALFSVTLATGQDMSLKGEPRIDSYYLQNTLFSINYNISLPVGDLVDYISDPGFTGFDAELKGFLTENIAVGGKIGVISFYEKYPRDTYYFESGALTTTIFNYYYTVPMHVVADYFFIPKSFIQPYAGLGVGINYNERRTEIGFYSLTDNSWNFALSPEAGVIVPFGKFSEWGLSVKARYNYQVYNRDRFNGMQYFDFSFGLSYSY